MAPEGTAPDAPDAPVDASVAMADVAASVEAPEPVSAADTPPVPVSAGADAAAIELSANAVSMRKSVEARNDDAYLLLSLWPRRTTN